jgi:hypothetical protein
LFTFLPLFIFKSVRFTFFKIEYLFLTHITVGFGFYGLYTKVLFARQHYLRIGVYVCFVQDSWLNSY